MGWRRQALAAKQTVQMSSSLQQSDRGDASDLFRLPWTNSPIAAGYLVHVELCRDSVETVEPLYSCHICHF